MALGFCSLFKGIGSYKSVTYDFIDIAGGIGYGTFYLKFNLTPGTKSWVRTSSLSSFDNGNEYTEVYKDTPNNHPNYAKVDTENYDLEFDGAVTVGGKMYINMKYYCTYADATNGVYFKFKYQPYHYDGSTETSLASQQTGEAHYAESGVAFTGTLFWEVDLTTKRFKAGDILRLKVETYATGDGYTMDLNIYGDNNTKWLVPFKINK